MADRVMTDCAAQALAVETPVTMPKSILATELWTIIIENLRNDELMSLRLTCRALSDIASGCLHRHVSFLFTKKGINRLRKISLHPIFSQNVTSIQYEGGRLSHYEQRRDWEAEIHPDQWPMVQHNTAVYPVNQLSEGWDQYQHHYTEQEQIQALRMDEREIARAILRFPKLDTIRLCIDHKLMGCSSNLLDYYRHTSLVIPGSGHGIYPYSPPGLRQYTSLMRGVAIRNNLATKMLLTRNITLPPSFDVTKTIKPLRVLHLGVISWYTFKAVPPPMRMAINASLTHVIDLKLLITTGNCADRYRGIELEMCNEYLAKGHLFRLLKSAPLLERLFLQFNSMTPLHQATSVKHTFGGFTWLHLKELMISNLYAPKKDLCDLLSRHQKSLNSWIIRGICLEPNAKWADAMKGLREVSHWPYAQLRGPLYVKGEPALVVLETHEGSGEGVSLYNAQAYLQRVLYENPFEIPGVVEGDDLS